MNADQWMNFVAFVVNFSCLNVECFFIYFFNIARISFLQREFNCQTQETVNGIVAIFNKLIKQQKDYLYNGVVFSMYYAKIVVCWV